MLTSATGAPKDYAELYEHYFPMIRSIVAKAGIAPGDVEDVSMDLLAKFMEKDALSWYDPKLLHDVGNRPRLEGERLRPAKFQGLLRQFCNLYVRQHLDRQAQRTRREPHHLEDRVGDGTWAEAHGDAHCTEPHLTVVRSSAASQQVSKAAHLLEAEHHEWEAVARSAAKAGDRPSENHANRRAAEAQRALLALVTARALASGDLHVCEDREKCSCSRVTAKAIAAHNEWSTGTASAALKVARAQLSAVAVG